MQKTDLAHGIETGIAFGGLAGIVGAAPVLILSPDGAKLSLALLLAGALGGASFGSWAAGMAGAGVPNSRLRAFCSALDSGAVLVMADVPFSRAEQIHALVTQRHPEAVPAGTEPTGPAFP